MSRSVLAATSVDDVLALYEGFAADPYDEAVSQLDHALQTAALAVAGGAPDELVVAALLHDVGHLLALRDDGSVDRAPSPGDDDGDRVHEARGARWLSRLYPPGVTGPIALHVAAKRYLCAVDQRYHRSLSDGSRASLVRQGGPMGGPDVARFRANPAHVAAVKLRGWDDSGKEVEGIEVPPLAHYRPLLERATRF